MAPAPKFTDEQLKQYLAMDFSRDEIARLFRVSRQAVDKRVAKFDKRQAVKEPAVCQAATASVWDTKAALEQNFSRCLELLQQCEEPGDRTRVVTEIRNHIKQGMDVLMTLYSLQEIAAFQDEVLTILEECDPGSRQRIVQRLQQRRAIRGIVTEGSRPLS